MSITPAADISSAVIDITTGLTGGAFVPITRNINTTVPLTGGGNLSADRTLALTTSPAGQTPVGVTRLINTSPPLQGGGDLSADRTLTVSQFDSANPGTVSGSGGGTTNFLRADNTWQAVAGGTGVPATRLVNTTLPLTGGGDLSADRTLAVNDFTPAARGTVPGSGGGIVNFLRADGAWAQPSVGSFVSLQPTTPGTADIGHAHITGTFISDSRVLAGTGASAGAAGDANFPVNGSVGILTNAGGTGGVLYMRQATNDGGSTQQYIVKSRGTLATPLATQANDNIVNFAFAGYKSTNLPSGPNAFMQAQCDGAPTATEQPLWYDIWAGLAATRHYLRLSQSGIRLGPNLVLADRALSTVDVVGSLGLKTVTKTANYTATATDYRILCDGTGGGFAITLPSAASLSGRTYEIIKIDSASTIITVSATISGAASIPLTGPMDAITVSSDGTFWWLVKDDRSNLVGQTVADSTAIANTTTKTAFSTAITIPANRAIFPRAAFVIEAGGTYSTTGTPTLTFFFSDTTNTADFATSPAITTPNNAASYLWFMRAAFVFRTVGGTVNPKLTWGEVGISDGSSVITERILSPAAGNTSTLASATYVPQVTWSAADPANTILMKSLAVFMYGNGARSS